MAHSPIHMRLMGKLVASLKDYTVDDFRSQYQKLLMEALRLKTTRRKHTDVLMHCMGFLKKLLSADEKKELPRNYRAVSSGPSSSHCARDPTQPLCAEIRSTLSERTVLSEAASDRVAAPESCLRGRPTDDER